MPERSLEEHSYISERVIYTEGGNIPAYALLVLKDLGLERWPFGTKFKGTDVAKSGD